MYDHRLKTWDGIPLDASITIEACGLGIRIDEETYPQRYKGFRPQTIQHELYRQGRKEHAHKARHQINA